MEIEKCFNQKLLNKLTFNTVKEKERDFFSIQTYKMFDKKMNEKIKENIEPKRIRINNIVGIKVEGTNILATDINGNIYHIPNTFIIL